MPSESDSSSEPGPKPGRLWVWLRRLLGIGILGLGLGAGLLVYALTYQTRWIYQLGLEKAQSVLPEGARFHVRGVASESLGDLRLQGVELAWPDPAVEVTLEALALEFAPGAWVQAWWAPEKAIPRSLRTQLDQLKGQGLGTRLDLDGLEVQVGWTGDLLEPKQALAKLSGLSVGGPEGPARLESLAVKVDPDRAARTFGLEAGIEGGWASVPKGKVWLETLSLPETSPSTPPSTAPPSLLPTSVHLDWKDLEVVLPEPSPSLHHLQGELTWTTTTPGGFPVLKLQGQAGDTGELRAELEPAPSGERLLAKVKLDEVSLENLPTGLAPEIVAGGRFAGDLELNLDPKDPSNLEQSQGFLRARGVRLLEREASLAKLPEVSLEVREDGLRVQLKGAVQDPSKLLPPEHRERIQGRGDLELALQSDRRLQVGELSLGVRGPSLRIEGVPLPSLAIKGSWTPQRIRIPKLLLQVGKAAKLDLSLEAPRDFEDPNFRGKGSLRLEGLDLAAPWLRAKAELGVEATLGLAAKFEIPKQDPLAGVVTGSVNLAQVRTSELSLAQLRIPFRVDPQNLEVGPIDALEGKGWVEDFGLRLELGPKGRAELSKGRYRGVLPRVGPARAELAGWIQAKPFPPATHALLKTWVDWAQGLSKDPHASLSFHLEPLSLKAGADQLFEGQRPLSGRVLLAGPSLELDAFPFTLFGVPAHGEGRIGPNSKDRFRLRFEDLDLKPLASWVQPGRTLAVQGTLKTDVEVAAALATPKVTAKLELAQGIEASLWAKSGEGIRRLGGKLPPQSFDLRLDGDFVQVDSEFLEGRLAPLGSKKPIRLHLKDFPLSIESKVFPERRQELGMKLEIQGEVSLPQAELDRLEGSLRILGKGELGGLADAQLDLGLDFDPSHLTLKPLTLRARDQDLLRLEAGIQAERVTPIRLEAPSFPLDWLVELGISAGPLQTLALGIQGEIQPSRPTQRGLVPLLTHLAEAPPGFHARFDPIRLDSQEGALLKSKGVLELHLEGGVLRVEPSELEVGGAPVRLGGTFGSPKGSRFQLGTESLPLETFRPLGLGVLPGKLGGTLEADFVWTGDTGSKGRVELRELDLGIPGFDSRLFGDLLARVEAETLRLEGRGLRVDAIPLQLEGSLPLKSLGPGQVTLAMEGVRLRRNRSALGPIRGKAQASLEKEAQRPRLSLEGWIEGGTLVLDDLGPMRLIQKGLESARGSGAGAEPPKTEADPAEPPPSSGDLPGGLEAVDVRFQIPTAIQVRNPLADLTLRADLTLALQKGRAPRFEAFAEVPKGAIYLQQHEFRVTRGRVRAKEVEATRSSSLDLAAEAQVASHRVILTIQGSLDEPLVEYRSIPARSEKEIAHLLATGSLPGQGETLGGAAQGALDFFAASSLNRWISSNLGLSSVRIRRVGQVQRIDVDKQLDERTTVSFSRSTDATQQLSIERRLGGRTTVEGGSRRDSEGSRPFVGIKRRIPIR